MNTPEHSFFGISAASVLNMQEEETEMLFWSITFLLLAIVAGVFGFGGIAGAAAGIAEILFFVFLVLLVISAIAAAVRGRPPL